MRQLRLSKADAVQQYRRRVFNIIARNQDDHTKNISFLMNTEGNWALSPAYDVIYSHNPKGVWTNQHQMTLAGKRDHFSLPDLLEVARWPDFARKAGVNMKHMADIGAQHRLKLS